MILYDNPHSGNCYKVRLIAAHLGVPLERRRLSVADRSNRPDVLGGLNPALRVPTLILDDGRPLAESGAILWYLADGTSYIPQDPYERAQVLQWMFFEQYDLEPSIAVVRFMLNHSGRPDDFADQIPAKREAGERVLAALEQHLAGRKFLVGDNYSIADIAVYGYTHVAHEAGFETSALPAVHAWLQRVASQPGHITIDA